jgi:serine protease
VTLVKQKQVCLSLLAAGLGLIASAQTLAVTSDQYAALFASEPLVTQLMVKLPATTANAKGKVMTQASLNSLMAASGLPLSYKRPMANGEHVLKLPYPMTADDAQRYADSLKAQGVVAEAEADRWVKPLGVVTPNDPAFYANQWSLQEANSGSEGAANLPKAWGITQGSKDITVAVVDTGILNHINLQNRLVNGNASLAGYDFITAATQANDGDGRDTNPADAGDWVTAAEAQGSVNCSPDSSSWHGTHVAGIIGASSNDGVGISGIDWNAQLLNVRVLGKCGGQTSDIVDGVVWAAGGVVPDVPTNEHPAQVINMSLGGPGACPSAMQGAINTAVAKGAVVVVAAGNELSDATNVMPANCKNVIAVASVGSEGEKSLYSNYGENVDIAAPGQNIYSTYNMGLTTPTADAYASMSGTSMAAPHVAGVASLMLAANANLVDGTIKPEKVAGIIENNLKASARAMTPQNTSFITYGQGLLDAYRALLAVTLPPQANAGADQAVTVNANVSLDASASKNNGYGTAALDAYLWEQVDGQKVTLSNIDKAQASFTAPATVGQILSFKVTVQNDVGLSSSDTVTITTNAAPASSGGGGGGSLSYLALLGLSALGCLRFVQRRSKT